MQKKSGKARSKNMKTIFLKILTVLLSLQLVTLPVTAKADVSPLGKVVDLKKGEKAPYTGILLDPVAASKMLVNEKYIRIETELRLRKELSLDISKKALAFDLLQTEYDSLKQIHVGTLKIKEQQIVDLNELVRKQASSDHSQWWLAGGVVIGIALSIAVFYASVEVAK